MPACCAHVVPSCPHGHERALNLAREPGGDEDEPRPWIFLSAARSSREVEFKRRSASSSFARSAAVSSTSPPSTREATPIGKRAARDGLKVPRGHPENLRQQNRISDENYWFCFSWKTRQKDHDLSERPSGHSTSHLSHVMAASYAADVGGGSHHDALLSLRDLPSFQDKYTVEVRRPFGQDTFPLFFSFSFVTSQRLGVRPTPPPRRCLRPMGSRSRVPTEAH